MNFFRFVPAVMLCMFSAAAFGQQVDKINFTFGDEYEIPKKHEDLGFVGNQADGYVQVGHREHESISLQKFSENYKLEGEKILSIKEMPHSYNSEMLRTVGKKHYWFFSTWDRKEDKESLYAQEIDVKNNQFTGGAHFLLSSKEITWVPDVLQVHSNDAYKGIHYTFYFSHDASKLLITYRRVPEEKRDKINRDKIGLCAFNIANDSMHLMWQKEVVMPYTEEKMDNDDYRIDKDGNAYLLAKVYNGDKSDKKTKSIFRYELLKWSAGNKELVKIPFAFKEKFVRHAFIQDYEGRIVVAGYYSTQKGQNVRELNGRPVNSFFSAGKSGKRRWCICADTGWRKKCAKRI